MTCIFLFKPDDRALDWQNDPVPQPLLDRLIRHGFPRDAVRANGTLDPDVCAEHGWEIGHSTLSGPG